MGIETKRVEGNLTVGGSLTARVLRKGKKRFEKKLILKGKVKDDRRKAKKRGTA